MVRIDFSFRHFAILVALFVVALLVYLLRDVVVLFALALMLTAGLHPLAALAERRGLSHTWAVAVVMLCLVLLPLGLLAALSPVIIHEVQSLAGSVPALQSHIDAILRQSGLASRVNDAIAKANPQERIGSLAVVSAQETVSILVQVVTIIVMTGYLLADGPHLKLVLHDFVPEMSERHIEPLLHGMERVVGGYIRGQVLTSALFGVYAFVLCLTLGVPSPLLLGIVAAIGDVIPLFGVPAAMLVAVLVAFTHSIWQSIAVLGGYLLYSQIESHFIAPRIYARTVNLSPLMVILATIAGGTLDGVIGILIAIPIVGVLKVVFDYIVAERRRGHEQASALMDQEESDPIGDRYTSEEAEAALGEAEDGPRAESIPPPSVSPFEPIPEGGSETNEDDELLQTVSARILRLEERVARLTELASEAPQKARADNHFAETKSRVDA